jgi:protein SCO1/2
MVTGAPIPPQTSTLAELADRVRIICSVYDPLTGKYRTNYALYFEIAGFISFLFFLGWIAWNFTRKAARHRRLNAPVIPARAVDFSHRIQSG